MKLIITTVFFAICLVFTSCYKQSKPFATLTIVDETGKPLSRATVNINSTSKVAGSIYDHTYYTTLKGEVPFQTNNECVLQADVAYKNLKGKALFQMKFDEITTKTIVAK